MNMESMGVLPYMGCRQVDHSRGSQVFELVQHLGQEHLGQPPHGSKRHNECGT